MSEHVIIIGMFSIAIRRPIAPPLRCSHFRSQSTLHFYQSRQLELYASKQANRMSLRQLVCGHILVGCSSSGLISSKVFFGRSIDNDRLIKVPFHGTSMIITS
jgi:hypothetical protein